MEIETEIWQKNRVYKVKQIENDYTFKKTITN